MDRKYWFWINNIPGIGNIKIRRLLKAFGDEPERVAKAGLKDLLFVEGISQADADKIKSRSLMEGIFKKYYEYNKCRTCFVFPVDKEYPARLKELYDRPNVLYYIGKLPSNKNKKIAVVGSRNCSEYGRSVALELGKRLSSAGADVISGLALGIDAASHQGAIMAGGATYAVLAGGVDVCYPRQNFNTYIDILKNGGVLSEFPPGTSTRPGMFPLRNRIISGLSDAVIIVEAGPKSGSLITAAQALDQNRTVYVIPGRITDADSIGCNRLIAQGAQIVSSYEELLRDLGLGSIDIDANKQINFILATDEKMLYSQLLDFSPKSLDSLINMSKLPQTRVFQALLTLELKGLIREISKNFYIRIM